MAYALFELFLVNSNCTEPHLSVWCVCQIYLRNVFTRSSRSYNWQHVSVQGLPEQACWRTIQLGELSSSSSTSFLHHGDVRLQNVCTPMQLYGWESEHRHTVNMSPWQSNNVITKAEITTMKFEVCERSDKSANLCATNEQRMQIRVQMSDLHYMKTKVHNWHWVI